ncbi:molybdopterin-dependent oxidoreductase [Meiothermus granaticius]|uniref:NADH-quinone oxidoreductase subunit 3 n=1 Tax=Meiothermus granaticius NBRC 107808 TaxID=1227551 RepID=A0A399F6P6_9DEIN|nr:molybdopterin-dependent oxidoreductase [Meiothermus granaticius]RIH91306.1 NADH-quinone oxidoreductase subunit 3 [Meiothermus granaticius NBRC 107808]GEM86127.1 NADH-quinone oxidoreductase subunit 3 [Meiothermus granaticius NBRC 107808]
MAKVTVNDRTIEVPNGTSAMDAIFHAGYDVPLFCAERYLSPVGACRMCLVKTGAPRKGPDGSFILDENGQPKIFWAPKLAASCVTAVTDGMAIDTLSDEVKHAQSGMVELTLFNHPLDCPTCDKGGACELQDRSYEYGLVEKFYQPGELELPLYTRYEMTRRHVDKHHTLSEFITLDRERCIHCKRCIRYFEEVPGDKVLDFIERGVHTFINTEEIEGHQTTLPSNFSGNITDICPVGALLDRTARFRGRNWEYDSVATTSMDDASGSGIIADTRSGFLERIRAQERREVNEAWISDAARFGHDWVNEGRVTRPLVRRDGRLVEVTWEEAQAAIKAGLAGVPQTRIGIYLPGGATLEEGLAAVELAQTLGTPHRDFQGRTETPATAFLAASFDELLDAQFVLVLGDPSEETPIVHLRLSELTRGLKPASKLSHGTPIADLNIKENVPRDRSKLALFSPYPAQLAKWAGASGTHRPGQEAALLAALLGQGEAPAGLEEALEWARKRLAESQKSVLILGANVLNAPEAATKAKQLAEKTGAKVLCLTPAANARGLEALGLYPAKGGAAWTEAGPQAVYYGYAPTEEQLKSAQFRILHLTHRNALTDRYADVILPNQTPYEKRGQTVNLEGRVLPLEPVSIDNGEADGAVAALAVLAEAIGVKPPVRLVRQATKLLAEKWKLPALMGRWNIKPASFQPSVSSPQPSTPVYLRPTMWRREQLTGAVAKVVRVALEASPEVARAHGLIDGATVELETPAGREKVTVKLVQGLPSGAMYLPALGPWVGRSLEARILVGGEA